MWILIQEGREVVLSICFSNQLPDYANAMSYIWNNTALDQ